MNTRLALSLSCLSLMLAAASSAADKPGPKPAPPTLEEVIFDAGYLKRQLGAKTLLIAGAKSRELTPELPQLMAKAGFKEVSRFYEFPAEGTPAKLYFSIPHSYPQSLRQGKDSGSAEFLVLIGADGKVQGIHCYRHTDRLFAIAYAAAISRWRYEPAKINGTAVPVLMDLPASYKGDGIDGDYLRPGLPPPETLNMGPPPPLPPTITVIK